MITRSRSSDKDIQRKQQEEEAPFTLSVGQGDASMSMAP